MINLGEICITKEFFEKYITNEFFGMYKAVKKNGSALEHQVSAELKNNVVFALCISRIHSDTDDWVRKKYIYNFFFKESLKLFGFPMACFALFLIGISLPPVFLPFLSAIFVGVIAGVLGGGLVSLIYHGNEIIHLYSTDPKMFSEFIDYLKECIDLKGKIHQYRLGYLLSRDLLNLGPIITVTTTLPKGVKEVSSSAYKGWTSLTHAVLPESVSEIDYKAFMNCTNLTTINIPESVWWIGSEAFRNCSSLTHFTIPKNVTEIHRDTFYGCTGLTHIDIPNSVRNIGSGAFQSCPNLKVIAIYNSNAGDYQRILNLLPPEQKLLAMPLSGLQAAETIKKQALKSVAARSMNGLTAHLILKLSIQPEQKFFLVWPQLPQYLCMFQNSHAYPIRECLLSSKLTPKFALGFATMFQRINERMAVHLNPAVAQIRLPKSPEEFESLFTRVVESLFPRVKETALDNPRRKV